MTYMCKLECVCVVQNSCSWVVCVEITSADGVRLFTEGHR